MQLETMHREDVKAELRKRFGSVAAFERKNSLPPKSVNEILRGRKSARVMDAIVAALTKPLPADCTENSSERPKAARRVEVHA